MQLIKPAIDLLEKHYSVEVFWEEDKPILRDILLKKIKDVECACDVHGRGVLEEGGREIVSNFHLDLKKVQIEMGTFSKAYGTGGDQISSFKDLIKFA